VERRKDKRPSGPSPLQGQTFLRRGIVVLIVALIVAYLAYRYDYFGGHAAKEAEKKAAEQTETTRRLARVAISRMASEFGANQSWEQGLSEGNKPTGRKGMNISELEKLWLTEKPILFTGQIEEVSGTDRDTYTVRITRHENPRSKTSFQGTLAILLECPRTMISSFFEKHPHAVPPFGQVAVVAKITKIETKPRETEQAESDIYIGRGRCLGIADAGPSLLGKP
jgi:hypothetical protein